MEIKTPKVQNITYNNTTNTNNTANSSITTTVEDWTGDVMEIANNTLNDII